MNSEPVKRCPMCEAIKPHSEYFKTPKGGPGPYCKPCSAARKRTGPLTQAEIRLCAFPEPGMKRCSKCDEVKALEAFGVTTRDGKPRYRPACKACNADIHRAWSKKTGRGEGRTRSQLHADLVAAIYVSPDTKVCTKCGVEKPRSEFTKFKDKLKHECKSCKNEMNVRRYAKNREREARRRAELKAKNPEAYREHARQGAQRRRARKANVPCTLTKEEWQEIVASYGDRCLCCGATGQMTVDHVIPISKGGGHTADNVQPLCGPCNSSKSVKIIDYRPGRAAA